MWAFPTEPRNVCPRRRQPQQNGLFPLLIADQVCRIGYRSTRVACWSLLGLLVGRRIAGPSTKSGGPDGHAVIEHGCLSSSFGHFVSQVPCLPKRFHLSNRRNLERSSAACPRGKGCALVQYVWHGHPTGITSTNVCDSELIFGDKMRLRSHDNACDLCCIKRNAMDNDNGIFSRVIVGPDSRLDQRVPELYIPAQQAKDPYWVAEACRSLRGSNFNEVGCKPTVPERLAPYTEA